MISQPSHSLVSILIVTWNRKDDLIRSIESARNQTYRNTEIIVVDNASTDGTAGLVLSRFPGIRLVNSEGNLGCPSGRNLGFSYCSGDFIYMLDDDGWLDEKALEISVRRAETSASIGVVMSRIHEMKDGKLVGRRPFHLDKPAFLDSFLGGCSLIRRQVLRDVGDFPDDFFRQGEESDLALRMLQAGYFCFFEPDSVMYHAPSPVGRNYGVFMYYNLRNTNRTGLRLWPFPWCYLRPVANLFRAIRWMVSLRDVSLPLKVGGDLLVDLFRLRGRRKPVPIDTFRLFRHLARFPSSEQPHLK